MKGFWELVAANVKDIVRDRMSIFWFLAFPMLFILIFGAVFGKDQDNTKYNIGLVVEDKSSFGVLIQKTLRSVPAFQIYESGKTNELQQLRRGKRVLVVVIPKNSKSVENTKPLEIPIYYDPSKTATAQVMISSIKELLSEIERNMTGAPKLFLAKPLKVETAQLKNIDYLLPGILAMTLMQLGLFGALNFVSLRERKIIRRLGATPLPRSMMLLSEVIVRLGMSLIQTTVIILLGKLAFGVTITHNIFGLLAIVILGASIFITLGYFLVSFTKTEESASGLVQLVQFPMMFLSGIFFPIEFMPDFLRPIVNAIPLTYLGDILRNVMVGMPSAFGVGIDLMVLGGWFLGTMVLAIRFFKWE